MNLVSNARLKIQILANRLKTEIKFVSVKLSLDKVTSKSHLISESLAECGANNIIKPLNFKRSQLVPVAFNNERFVERFMWEN